jgi:type IV secretion system protein VirB3
MRQDTIFLALTRPQMFAGVTYSFFVANMIVAAEFFLIFKSLWAIAPAAIIHITGVLLCLREPRFFDLWLARARLCPRVRNHALWRCNSYRP